MAKSLRIPFSRPYFPRAALTENNLEFWVGRQSEIDRLVRGLLSSTDAHYLITGYPGVGKTSFVSRAIAEWRRLCPQHGINRVLIFNLQFAQPQSADEVVQRLIGKVYFGSLDGQFSPDEQLAKRLKLNFIQAHSKSVKEKQSQGTRLEEGSQAKLGLPAGASILGGMTLNAKQSEESTSSLEIEREYNLSAVVSDLEEVIHLLTKPNTQAPKGFWSWWPFFRSSIKYDKPRLLFIFDQIDDLESVRALSPLFSLPHASFIVLGGVTLKEQVASAKERGLQVLDSFQEEYLPCQWNQAERILSLLISSEDVGARRFADYRDFLNFSAQGLPRRIFSAIDQHTKLLEDKFYLQLREADMVRVRLTAKLHRVIWKNRKKILGEYIDSVQFYPRDKALRGTYHLADRIFRTARFTYQDANTVVTQMSDAIAHRERERVLRNLLDTCVEEGLIVSKGNTYGLAEDILRAVKRMPDWLKDGFVDAHEFLVELKQRPDRDPEQTGTLHLSPHSSDADLKPTTVFRRREHGVPPLLEESLPRYKIIHLIGKGGMGEVYLAEDQMLQRKVALKVIHSAWRGSSEGNSRFLREGRAIAQLNHPNIVSIFDMQELPTGQIVLVSEFVDGVDLNTEIKGGRLSVEESVRIGIQIADALETAHAQGIIHRDVKPSNILLTEDRYVKLLDFGVAKLTSDIEAYDEPITRTGEVIGTPIYMSPEQFQGENVDARADIYSLGVVLFEMLTGELPFKGKGVFEMMTKIMMGPPPLPSEDNPLVPAELDQIVLRCLEPKRKDRFPTAAELSLALDNVRNNLPEDTV